MTTADGVLLAERTEGIATVAHALAYCQAVERMAGAEVPWAAALIRVVHAELERLACHLDVIVRLADGAGLAVATARFGWHKEQVLRLVGELCGSRFGRGVVVPGGVRAALALGPGDLLAAVGELDRRIGADLRVLTGTASFLDRLRRTGPLPPERARGARRARPDRPRIRDYATTRGRPGPTTGTERWPCAPPAAPDGDALARLEVRVTEIAQSVPPAPPGGRRTGWPGRGHQRRGQRGAAGTCEVVAGRDVGWAEAPQGEVLYDVSVSGGRITRCRARSASFHNLVLMHEVFAGDILTDFPFIEASFGLSVAGVAR